MTKLVNRAKMTTTTTGTGTITLSSAVAGYQSFADAGVVNGDVTRNVIEDGEAWEISTGTYSATGATLTRTLVESSTGALLNLSGEAVVYVTAAADDIQQTLAEGAFVDGDKTKLNGIEAGATADQTASEILTAIKTVDGSGSGLDADLLDGQQGSYYYPASNPNGYTTNVGDITGVTAGAGIAGGGTSGTVTVSHADTSAQASLTALTGANVVSDIDLDTYGHVTALSTRAMTAADLGALTGNQAITLSGDVSGSGTTSIVVTVADDSHNHIISNVDGLQAALDAKLDDSQKGAANGLAELDATGKVPSAQLPSYVDDVLEYANAGLFPATGEAGKLYVALDSNDVYRWTGSAYVKVSDAVSTADQATKLATARNIALSGDVSGSANFDGSANISITATVADDSHNHIIGNVDGLQTALNGKLSTTGKAADSNLLDGLDSTAFYLASNPNGYTTNTGTVTSVGATAGTGISVTGSPITTSGTLTVTNTAPHQATNLGITGTGNTRTITSSTGTNVTVPVATTTTAGLMALGDKSKLDGIATGATANAGTVTSVAASAGTGISITGSPITSSGTLTVTNTAPHIATNLGYTGSTRVLTSSTGTNVTLPQVTTTVDGLMIAADKTKLNGIAAGAQVNVATNLSYTGAATTGTVNSSTGTNATVPAATTTVAGLLTGADKTKLDGIASGAQVNVATNLGITAGTTAGPVVTSSTGTNATLPTASATASGVVTTGTQTFAGAKTFSSTIAGSVSGNATTATTLQTSRNIALTGAVTGNANFNGGGNISITTTATSDPTLTLAGDATGSATFTNLGNATLTVTVADDSHNHLISNVDGLQTALDGKLSTSGKAADSNLLDGIDSSQFLRSDVSDSISGPFSVTYPESTSTAYSITTNAVTASPFGVMAWHDLFAFDRAFTTTYETFSGSWSPATLNNSLFAQKENQVISLATGSSPTQVRFTWQGTAWGSGEWLVIGFTYTNPAASKTLTFESSADGISWTQRHQSTTSANASVVYCPINPYSGDNYLRLTISRNDTNDLKLSFVSLLTVRAGDQGRGKELSYPYDWNGDREVFFPNTISVPQKIQHTDDTDTYMEFHAADQFRVVTGNVERFEINNSDVTVQSALKEKYVNLSGTSPNVDVDAGGSFSLTTSGNTTFTFSAFTSGLSTGFILELTAGGDHIITWPASVDWAGGTAPDAPASGETDIYVFWSRNGGTTWYGVQSVDAAA